MTFLFDWFVLKAQKTAKTINSYVTCSLILHRHSSWYIVSTHNIFI